MRSTLFASVAALGLAMAIPALADTGNAPNIPASAGNHAVIMADGGDWIGNDGSSFHQQQQRVADGGDWVGNDGSSFHQQQRVADGGDWVGNDGSSFHKQQA
jgi:hypothetical protein